MMYILASGLKIKCQAREGTFSDQDKSMLVLSKMEIKMVTENLCMQMGKYMKVIGIKTKNVDLAS